MNERKKEILKQLGGISETLYDTLVDEFIVQAKKHMLDIETYISGNEIGEIGAVAHTLKGAAANLRLPAIEKAAAELEVRVKQAEERQGIAAVAGILKRSIGEAENHFHRLPKSGNG